MQSPQLLKVRESADALNCSVPMVRKLIRAGSLPAVRVGRALRVPASAVEALIAGDDLPADPESTSFNAQVSTLIKAQVVSLVKAEMSAILGPQLARLRQEIRELRHETHPKGAA